MVYKHNDKGILARYSRTGWKGSSVAAKASKALALASYAAHHLNAEKKFYDSAQSGLIPVTGASSAHLLTQIPQGLGELEREGGQVKVVSIQGRITYNFNSLAGTALGQTVRLMIVLDKEEGLVTGLTPGDLLQNTTVPTVSPMLWNNAMRYRILMDKIITLDADDPVKNVKFYFKFKRGIRVRFFGSASVNNTTNGIYWITYHDTTNPSNTPIQNGYLRLRFMDN
jgi:hypothetical protein